MSHAAAKNYLRDGVHHGSRIATREDHAIIECEICGFKHALPLPDAAALEEVYREDYYTQEKPTFLAHAGEDQFWGELAQTDRLEILETPGRARCKQCGVEMTLEQPFGRCGCGNSDLEWLAGDELKIKELEIP